MIESFVFYRATSAFRNHTLQLLECQGTPCSKQQAQYLKLKRLQQDTHPQQLFLKEHSFT